MTHLIHTSLQKLTEANEDLSLPTVSVSSLNSDQEYAFNIIMKTLFEYKNQDFCFKPPQDL